MHLPRLGSTRRRRQGAPGTPWCRLRRRRRPRPPAGAALERTTRAAGDARPSRPQHRAALGPRPPACAPRAPAPSGLRSCASAAPQAPETRDAVLAGACPPRGANGTFQHQYGAPGILYFFLLGLYSDTLKHFRQTLLVGAAGL